MSVNQYLNLQYKGGLKYIPAVKQYNTFLKDRHDLMQDIIETQFPFINKCIWNEIPTGLYLILGRKAEVYSIRIELIGIRTKRISVVFCINTRKAYYVFDNRPIYKLLKRNIPVDQNGCNDSMREFILNDNANYENWPMKSIIGYGSPIRIYWDNEYKYFNFEGIYKY